MNAHHHGSVSVLPVPCLRDNYAYLVWCTETRDAAVVDPGEAAPVLAAAQAHGVNLRAVWATHHHHDHVGGIAGVLAACGPLEVVSHGTDAARIAAVTRMVADGDEIRLGNTTWTIVHNPGHTLGAISFYQPSASVLFTGDTLFAGGCGRLFEGSAEMMHASLACLASLGAEHIYVGHEYTASNLRFAAQLEPANAAIRERLAALPAITTPTSTLLERATNPFLRCHVPAVAAAVGAHDQPAHVVFAAVRAAKDRF